MQTQRAWAVPFRLLLAIYAPIPVVCLVILADRTLLQGSLQTLLPEHPSRWPLFNWFFIWPHIFASQMTLLDWEYLVEYRQRLTVGLPLVALAGGAAAWFPDSFGRLVFDLFTIYHVITQQTGIAQLMRGQTDRVFRTWSWLFLGSFALGHAGPPHLETGLLVGTMGIGLVASSLFALWAMRSSGSRLATLYLAANQLMLLLAVGWYLAGYPVFSFLIPRAVHDLTAFTFYVVHDHNRNGVQPHNFLFRLLRPAGIPPGWAGLLAGITLNVWTRSWQGLSTLPQIYLSIAFLHYYTEGIVWKRHTIHRRSILFQT